ncbi:MAG TPA: trans-aconitate 2-methyltransferase [Solirubrobacteraceae bacterium]|nr:trans-aconitate 2-methyltransferase [Solirubrobacteraceae bacterium]
MRWDPVQYARFGDERGRPFLDLLARVGATAPRRVVDLGCGTGELTMRVAERWPEARIEGVDASAEMIARAAPCARVSFAVGDARDFHADGVDVLLSNAMLQWVPDHGPLLARWARELPAGGWLAVQVPANFDAPSHRLMRELADTPRWRPRLGGVLRHADAVASPIAYLELLSAAGMRVEAWQTEYIHVLEGPDPVLEWVRGTGLRPVLAVLDAEAADAFEAEYAAALREAYPARAVGTVFPFRRTFLVAVKPAA